MENQERTNQSGKPDRGEEVFSKNVRAGKRTYFFDVKQTSKNDLYMVITESRRMFRDDGSPYYDRNKIHLHREDFDKFMEGIEEAITYARANNPPQAPREPREPRFNENHSNHDEKIDTQIESKPSSFTDVNFDDLGS
jgi:hypothetical protein